jgi:hypothetical protein
MFNQKRKLLEAQQRLNEKYVPNWRNSITLEQFLTATIIELAEWFKSAPKSGGISTNGVEGWNWLNDVVEDDVQNKKAKVVDIFSFMMSSWLLISDIETVAVFLEFGCRELPNKNSNLMNIIINFQTYIHYTYSKDINMSISAGLRMIGRLLKESNMTWEDLDYSILSKESAEFVVKQNKLLKF